MQPAAPVVSTKSTNTVVHFFQRLASMATFLLLVATASVAVGTSDFEPRFGPATPDVLLMFVRSPNATSMAAAAGGNGSAAAVGVRCVAAVAAVASVTPSSDDELRLIEATRTNTDADYRVAVQLSVPSSLTSSSNSSGAAAALVFNRSATTIARVFRTDIAAHLASSSGPSEPALVLLELAAMPLRSVAAGSDEGAANTTSTAPSEVAAGAVAPSVYDVSAAMRRAETPTSILGMVLLVVGLLLFGGCVGVSQAAAARADAASADTNGGAAASSSDDAADAALDDAARQAALAVDAAALAASAAPPRFTPTLLAAAHRCRIRCPGSGLYLTAVPGPTPQEMEAAKAKAAATRKEREAALLRALRTYSASDDGEEIKIVPDDFLDERDSDEAAPAATFVAPRALVPPTTEAMEARYAHIAAQLCATSDDGNADADDGGDDTSAPPHFALVQWPSGPDGTMTAAFQEFEVAPGPAFGSASFTVRTSVSHEGTTKPVALRLTLVDSETPALEILPLKDDSAVLCAAAEPRQLWAAVTNPDANVSAAEVCLVNQHFFTALHAKTADSSAFDPVTAAPLSVLAESQQFRLEPCGTKATPEAPLTLAAAPQVWCVITAAIQTNDGAAAVAPSPRDGDGAASVADELLLTSNRRRAGTALAPLAARPPCPSSQQQFVVTARVGDDGWFTLHALDSFDPVVFDTAANALCTADAATASPVTLGVDAKTRCLVVRGAGSAGGSSIVALKTSGEGDESRVVGASVTGDSTAVPWSISSVARRPRGAYAGSATISGIFAVQHLGEGAGVATEGTGDGDDEEAEEDEDEEDEEDKGGRDMPRSDSACVRLAIRAVTDGPSPSQTDGDDPSPPTRHIIFDANNKRLRLSYPDRPARGDMVKYHRVIPGVARQQFVALRPLESPPDEVVICGADAAQGLTTALPPGRTWAWPATAARTRLLPVFTGNPSEKPAVRYVGTWLVFDASTQCFAQGDVASPLVASYRDAAAGVQFAAHASVPGQYAIGTADGKRWWVVDGSGGGELVTTADVAEASSFTVRPGDGDAEVRIVGDDESAAVCVTNRGGQLMLGMESGADGTPLTLRYASAEGLAGADGVAARADAHDTAAGVHGADEEGEDGDDAGRGSQAGQSNAVYPPTDVALEPGAAAMKQAVEDAGAATRPKLVLLVALPIALALLFLVVALVGLALLVDEAGTSAVPWAAVHGFASDACAGSRSWSGGRPVAGAAVAADGACRPAVGRGLDVPLFMGARCASQADVQVRLGWSQAACEGAEWSGPVAAGTCASVPGGSDLRPSVFAEAVALAVACTDETTARTVAGVSAADSTVTTLLTVLPTTAVAIAPTGMVAEEPATGGAVLRAAALAAQSAGAASTVLVGRAQGGQPIAMATAPLTTSPLLQVPAAVLGTPGDLGSADTGRLTLSVWVALPGRGASGFAVAVAHGVRPDDATTGAAVADATLDRLSQAVAGGRVFLPPPIGAFYGVHVDAPTKTVSFVHRDPLGSGELVVLRWPLEAAQRAAARAGGAPSVPDVFDGQAHLLSVRSASRKKSGRYELLVDGVTSEDAPYWQQCGAAPPGMSPLAAGPVALLGEPAGGRANLTAGQAAVVTLGYGLLGRTAGAAVGDAIFVPGRASDGALREAAGYADGEGGTNEVFAATVAVACVAAVALLAGLVVSLVLLRMDRTAAEASTATEDEGSGREGSARGVSTVTVEKRQEPDAPPPADVQAEADREEEHGTEPTDLHGSAKGLFGRAKKSGSGGNGGSAKGAKFKKPPAVSGQQGGADTASAGGQAHAVVLDALTATQSLDLYFTGWAWPATFEVPMSIVIFIPALDLSLDFFSLPPLLTPLAQLAIALLVIVVALRALAADNRRFLARLPLMAKEAREGSALAGEAAAAVPLPSVATPALDDLYDVRVVRRADTDPLKYVPNAKDPVAPSAAEAKDDTCDVAVVGNELLAVAAALEAELASGEAITEQLRQGAVPTLTPERRDGVSCLRVSGIDGAVSGLVDGARVRVDRSLERPVLRIATVHDAPGSDSAAAATSAAAEVDSFVHVQLRSVETCPSHPEVRLIRATDAEHRRLAEECRADGRDVPYVCVHTQAPFASGLLRTGCDVDGGFYVCPECTFTVCFKCAKLSGAAKAKAWIATKRFEYRDTSLLMGVLIVAGVEALYVPVVKNAMMIVRCHRDYQCVFPGCYDEGSATYGVAVALSLGMLCAVGLGVPAFLFGLLIERKRAVIGTVFGDGVPQHVTASDTAAGGDEEEQAAAAAAAPVAVATTLPLSQVLWYQCEEDDWAHVLKYDRSVLKGVYATFELRYIWMQPATLLFKLALVAGVVGSPAGSVAQLGAAAGVQTVLLFVAVVAEPFIDRSVDHLTKVSSLYQVGLLFLMAVLGALEASSSGGVAPASEEAMAALMLVITGMYVAFLAFVVVSIVRAFKHARLMARVRLGVFAAIRDRDMAVLKYLAEHEPTVFTTGVDPFGRSALQAAATIPPRVDGASEVLALVLNVIEGRELALLDEMANASSEERAGSPAGGDAAGGSPFSEATVDFLTALASGAGDASGSGGGRGNKKGSAQPSVSALGLLCESQHPMLTTVIGRIPAERVAAVAEGALPGAAAAGSLGLVQRLVDAVGDAQLNVDAALMAAVQGRSAAIVRLLLPKSEVGDYLLWRAAVDEYHSDVFTLLLRRRWHVAHVGANAPMADLLDLADAAAGADGAHGQEDIAPWGAEGSNNAAAPPDSTAARHGDAPRRVRGEDRDDEVLFETVPIEPDAPINGMYDHLLRRPFMGDQLTVVKRLEVILQQNGGSQLDADLYAVPGEEEPVSLLGLAVVHDSVNVVRFVFADTMLAERFARKVQVLVPLALRHKAHRVLDVLLRVPSSALKHFEIRPMDLSHVMDPEHTAIGRITWRGAIDRYIALRNEPTIIGFVEMPREVADDIVAVQAHWHNAMLPAQSFGFECGPITDARRQLADFDWKGKSRFGFLNTPLGRVAAAADRNIYSEPGRPAQPLLSHHKIDSATTTRVVITLAPIRDEYDISASFTVTFFTLDGVLDMVSKGRSSPDVIKSSRERQSVTNVVHTYLTTNSLSSAMDDSADDGDDSDTDVDVGVPRAVGVARTRNRKSLSNALLSKPGTSNSFTESEDARESTLVYVYTQSNTPTGIAARWSHLVHLLSERLAHRLEPPHPAFISACCAGDKSAVQRLVREDESLLWRQFAPLGWTGQHFCAIMSNERTTRLMGFLSDHERAFAKRVQCFCDLWGRMADQLDAEHGPKEPIPDCYKALMPTNTTSQSPSTRHQPVDSRKMPPVSATSSAATPATGNALIDATVAACSKNGRSMTTSQGALDWLASRRSLVLLAHAVKHSWHGVDFPDGHAAFARTAVEQHWAAGVIAADAICLADPTAKAARLRIGTALWHHAAAAGSVTTLQLLLQRGVPFERSATHGSRGAALAHFVRDDAVHTFLLKCGVDFGSIVDSRDADMRTPLLRAAAAGDVGKFNWLLSQGAAIDATDKHGKTAELLAASAKSIAIVVQYRNRYPDTPSRDDKGRTALMVARGKIALELIDRYPQDLWAATHGGDTAAGTQLRRGLAKGVWVLDRMRAYLEDSNAVSDTERQAALNALFGGRRFTFTVDRKKHSEWYDVVQAQRKRCGLPALSSLEGIVGVPQIIKDAVDAWRRAEIDGQFGESTASESDADDGGEQAINAEDARREQLATLRWLVRTWEGLPDEEQAMASPDSRVDEEAPRALYNPLHAATWLSVSVSPLATALDLRFSAGCVWPEDCTSRLPEEHADPREHAMLAAMAEADAGATTVEVKGKESKKYPVGTAAETLAAIKAKRKGGDVVIDPTLPPPVATAGAIWDVLQREAEAEEQDPPVAPTSINQDSAARRHAFDASYFGSRRSHYPLYAALAGSHPSKWDTAAVLLERHDANPFFLFDPTVTAGPNRVIHLMCRGPEHSARGFMNEFLPALASSLRRRYAASERGAVLLPATPDGDTALHLALDAGSGSSGAAVIAMLVEYYREVGLLDAALAAVNKDGLTPLECAAALPDFPYKQIQPLVDACGRGSLDGTVRIKLTAVHGAAAKEYAAANPSEHDRPLAAALMERAITDAKPGYGTTKPEVASGFKAYVTDCVKHLAAGAVNERDLRDIVLPVWWQHRVDKTGTCSDLNAAIKEGLTQAVGGAEALAALDPGDMEARIKARDAAEERRKERAEIERSEQSGRWTMERDTRLADRDLERQHADGLAAIKKKESAAGK